jgi:Carboxypeptidase regulatory-like domain
MEPQHRRRGSANAVMLYGLRANNFHSGEPMRFWFVRILLSSLVLLLSLFLMNGNSDAQTPTGSLNGVVTDPSGGVIAKAAVRLISSTGKSLDTITNRDGSYEFKGLVPGTYSLKGAAKGFAIFDREDVHIVAGQMQQLNIGLVIQVEEQKVEVTDSPTKLEVDPSSNAGMVVMKGKDLEALSDDPDELQSELQALAGPSAGPNGGQIYIDGFTGGTLPPKDSIREIRINQNPFSAEYDRLGYGRIEILTKPGTDQFHGQLFLTGNTSAFNSRNPFEITPVGTQPPGYDSRQFSANVGGPLVSKKASFFFNIERRDINELSVVSAQIVDPTTFAITPFSDAVPNPRTRTNLSPRLDYQLTPTNTLTARYQYERENETNKGIGQFNLRSTGFNQLNTEHQIQISDTQVVNPKTINETRFRFVRETSDQTPQDSTPTISALGAFNSGGNGSGVFNDTLTRYELQNYTSMSLGKHFLKFGVRLRVNRDVNESMSNFNSTFTFAGIQAYQITVQGLAQGMTMAQIIAAGGGASQYSITTGSARANVTYFDVGPYFQDDWRLKPNITFSYGLRYESQNNIGDHADLAPRLGLAWGIDGSGKKSPKMVLRAGFGAFYDRFSYDLVLQQERLNNVTQQQFVVANPQFYLTNTPPPSALQGMSTAAPTLYQPNPNLRTPYTMQTGLTLERQLTKFANLSVTYLTSRGVHQFFTENINAPICSAPCDPATSPHPLGNTDNVYQYQSEGIFKQNQLIINSSVRVGTNLSLFGYYTLHYANSDTSGAGSFPSTLNDISLDYGRAPFDVRHRIFFGGTIGLPHSFRLSPFFVAQSGVPFNITTGKDLNGDSSFNDRPAFATSQSNPQNVITNKYGSFDLIPHVGEAIVPIDSLTSAGRFSLNLRLSKTFGFGKKAEPANSGPGGPGGGGTFGRGPGGPGGGPRGGGGDRGGGMFGGGTNNNRYNLTFSVAARNIFNNVNVATPIGNLTSPLFGKANGLFGLPYSTTTANRRIDLQVSFNF